MLVCQYVLVVIVQNPQKRCSVQVVLQVLYLVLLAKPKQLLQIKSSFWTSLVVLVRFQSLQMLPFQIQWVTSQKHVDDEFWYVCSLFLICFLLIFGMVDNVFDVVLVPLEQILGLEYLLGFAMIMRMFWRVDLDDLLMISVIVGSAFFFDDTVSLCDLLHCNIFWEIMLITQECENIKFTR